MFSLVQCLQLHSLATPQTRAIPMNAINSRRGPSHSKQGENSRLLLNQNSEYYKYKNVRFARPVSMTTSPPASNPTNATTRRLGPSHSTLEKILSNFKNPEGERAKIISLEKKLRHAGFEISGWISWVMARILAGLAVYMGLSFLNVIFVISCRVQYNINVWETIVVYLRFNNVCGTDRSENSTSYDRATAAFICAAKV